MGSSKGRTKARAYAMKNGLFCKLTWSKIKLKLNHEDESFTMVIDSLKFCKCLKFSLRSAEFVLERGFCDPEKREQKLV